MNSRRDLRRSLVAIAGGQEGYFSAAQGMAAGYSYQAQRHHVEAGNWIRVDRAIFRLRDWPPAQHGDLIRWSLWTRGRGVVSHDSALAVHDIGDANPSRIHLSVPAGFRARAPGVILHTVVPPDHDIEQHDGFRVTTTARSLLDYAASDEAPARIEDTIREAVRKGVVSTTTLRDRADEFGATAALRIERALRGSI